MTPKRSSRTIFGAGNGRMILAAVALATLAVGCAKREAAAPAKETQPAVVRVNPRFAQAASERELRARLRHNPRDPAAYEALANWLMIRRAQGVEAMNLARRAAALDEGNARRWLLLARACDQAGRYSRAIEAATHSLELEPGVADALELRGRVRARMDDFAGALEDFREAAALEPGNPGLGRLIGVTLQEMGDIEGAIVVFNELLAAHPEHAPGYAARAGSLRRAGRLEEARSDLERAAGIEPKNAMFWDRLGDVFMGMRMFAEAEAAYSRAVRLQPGFSFYMRDRGMARLRLGDADGAFADLDRAVALDPKNRFVISGRARAKRDMGDFAGAIEDFGRAIRLEPDSGYLWRQRANTRFAAGEFRDALKDLERAMQLATEVEPYEHFWDFVFRVRMGEPAGRDAIDAIARDNEDPWIRSLAGFLGGEIDEARLFAIADEASGRKKAEQQCEAFCYAALLRVARGESGARELFEMCVALEIVDFYEHTFAMGELSRMSQP